MSKDRWVLVQDDGTIILREENDAGSICATAQKRWTVLLRWTSSDAAIRSVFSDRPRSG